MGGPRHGDLDVTHAADRNGIRVAFHSRIITGLPRQRSSQISFGVYSPGSSCHSVKRLCFTSHRCFFSCILYAAIGGGLKNTISTNSSYTVIHPYGTFKFTTDGAGSFLLALPTGSYGLSAIKPMKAVFDHNYVKKIDGPNIKKGKNKLELAEQLRQDIRDFRILMRLRVGYPDSVSEREILRNQSETALRRSEEKFRDIFENAPVGIFQSSVDGRFIGLNETLAAMYQYLMTVLAGTRGELSMAGCTEGVMETETDPAVSTEAYRISTGR